MSGRPVSFDKACPEPVERLTTNGRRRPLLLLAVFALLNSACAQRGAENQEVTGVVIDVQAREIVHADSIRIRDASGREWDFQVSPQVASDPAHPNTASHLRQHMVFGDAVIVHYQGAGNELLAVQILDVSGQ